MRRLWVLLLALTVAPLTAGDIEYIPPGGGGLGIPGLTGTTGNELTVQALTSLRSFQALPELPKVYFSADDNMGCDPVLSGPNAGTCLPTGNDTTGNGTAELPYLTLTKCEELSQFGYLHCVFDSLDEWDTTDEETGDNGYSLTTTAANCTDEENACVVWGSSDRTGGDPVVVDCAGMYGGGAFSAGGIPAMFYDGRTSASGWWAFENMVFENCQGAGVTDDGDIFVGGDGGTEPARIALLNVSTPDINGDSNQRYTSHNDGSGGTNQAMLVDINPYCHINDWDNSGAGSQKSQCWRNAGNSDMIIVGGESSTSDDDAAKSDTDVLLAANGGSGVSGVPRTRTTVVAHTFRNNIATSAGATFGHVAVDLSASANNEEIISGIMLSNFYGFTAISSDRVFFGGSALGVTGWTSSLYLYRNSFSAASKFAHYFYNNSSTGSSDSIEMTCNAVDGITGLIFHIRAIDPTDTCAGFSIDMLNNVMDESTVANEFQIEDGGVTDNYATSTLFVAGLATHACGASTLSGRVDDTTPFGTSVKSPFCRDSSCFETCPTQGGWTIPDAGYIPAFYLGGKVRRLEFTVPANVGR